MKALLSICSVARIHLKFPVANISPLRLRYFTVFFDRIKLPKTLTTVFDCIHGRLDLQIMKPIN